MALNLTHEEKVTSDSYSRNAQSWAKTHSSNYWKEKIDIFRSILPSGKILEVGCAGGRDGNLLTLHGYDYVGTDVSEGFVGVAKRKYPDLKFLTRSIYELEDEFDRNSFDGIWASAVLLHVPKKRIKRVLHIFHKLLRVGGIAFITIKAGKGERVVKDKSRDGKEYERLWTFYSKKEFWDLLEGNGLKVVKYFYYPATPQDRWLIFFARNVK